MSFITDIRASWAESLGYFSRLECKQLGLLVLNTVRMAATIIFRQFGFLYAWLLGSLLCCALLMFFMMSGWVDSFSSELNPNLFIGTLITISPLVIALMIVLGVSEFLFFLAARASTESKDTSYFKLYFSRVFGFFCIWLFVYSLAVLITGIPLLSNYLVMTYVFNFSVLFFLDAKHTIKNIFISVYNGFKMVFYFLPVLLVLSFAQLIIAMIFGYIFGAVVVWNTIEYILLIPICSVLYTKIKHTNYRLFFKS